ncbi:type II toxin-antitoxin system HigB family toxin [Pedobacter sp. BS3]|uniref:type II toxin-antitoxin system HigB family toxin n=1 Tax=Pedobacter sp. BS3 TaxID=2567937 RepID=UPI0011EEC82B|nr:type II toxin-antitoxin system HigB family toxin [Pedobacter sp. BS3]
MVIIAKTSINIFAHKHPASKAALNSWYQIVKEVNWGNFNDVRNTFGSVDAVGNDRY